MCCTPCMCTNVFVGHTSAEQDWVCTYPIFKHAWFFILSCSLHTDLPPIPHSHEDIPHPNSHMHNYVLTFNVHFSVVPILGTSGQSFFLSLPQDPSLVLFLLFYLLSIPLPLTIPWAPVSHTTKCPRSTLRYSQHTVQTPNWLPPTPASSTFLLVACLFISLLSCVPGLKSRHFSFFPLVSFSVP